MLFNFRNKEQPQKPSVKTHTCLLMFELEDKSYNASYIFTENPDGIFQNDPSFFIRDIQSEVDLDIRSDEAQKKFWHSEFFHPNPHERVMDEIFPSFSDDKHALFNNIYDVYIWWVQALKGAGISIEYVGEFQNPFPPRELNAEKYMNLQMP